MSALAFGCRCLLIGVFAISGLSKLRSGPALRGFAVSLVAMRLLPARRALMGAAVVAGCELALVVLLCVPATVLVGFAGAAAMLVALSAGIVWSLANGVSVPCHCFGTSRRPVGRVHLVRNAALLGAAVAGGAAAAGTSAPLHPTGAALGLFFAALGLLGAVYFDDVVSLFGAEGVSS